MKTAFYPRLALDGIRKNRRLYLPYLGTCVLTALTYYILTFLSECDLLGASTHYVMKLGSYVIAFFSVIFLFYSNSFLMRRRKKEFGLYNVLGMDKHGISRILAYETLFTEILTLVFGLAVGVALSSVSERILCRLSENPVVYSFRLSAGGILRTAILFTGIFLLLFLNGLRQIRFTGTAYLMRSDKVGEKPPRAHWVLGIAGAVLLGVAYWVAASIQNPVQAALLFFGAVILVIVATYLLMIAGSVTLCKALQKKETYYYNPKHFVSVSSMAYRMTRNGAGLASVCVLLTMVLVMISSTACLYFGAEDSLRTNYPRDMCVTVTSVPDTAPESDVWDRISAVLSNADVVPTDVYDYRSLRIDGILTDCRVGMDVGAAQENDSTQVTLHILPAADYGKLADTENVPGTGEAYLFASQGSGSVPAAFTIGTADTSVAITVTRVLSEFPAVCGRSSYLTAEWFLAIGDTDYATLTETLLPLRDAQSDPLLTVTRNLGWNWDVSGDTANALFDDVWKAVGADASVATSTVLAATAAREDFYGSYSGLFFLGILLSIVFLVAAVLMIYYKQISEGFEDAPRFHIMKNIGMTERDIRRNIRSQMLTVFFSPLFLALLHLAFSFPMVQKLLLLFGFSNVWLFLLTTGISALLIGGFYLLVYRLTSGAYFKIVNSESQ